MTLSSSQEQSTLYEVQHQEFSLNSSRQRVAGQKAKIAINF
jgi:hypothetical protein